MSEIDDFTALADRVLWRPIETCPRDEAILIAGGNVLYPIVASWSGRADEPWHLDAQGYLSEELDAHPAYWMPLPDPPPEIES